MKKSTREGKLTLRRQDVKMNENEIGKAVVDSAVKVYQELGAGLLEPVYEVVLPRECENLGVFASWRETQPRFEPNLTRAR